MTRPRNSPIGLFLVIVLAFSGGIGACNRGDGVGKEQNKNPNQDPSQEPNQDSNQGKDKVSLCETPQLCAAVGELDMRGLSSLFCFTSHNISNTKSKRWNS